MSTRSKSDKDQVDDLYKQALENQGKIKLSSSTPYTSTPLPTFKPTPRQIFTPNVGETAEDKQNITDKSEQSDFTLHYSDDSSNKTIQPGRQIEYNSFISIAETMAHTNPFATLKYAVEAVPFFDGKNIPLTYFIEECKDEAKAMLPNEAESQFTKIIRTRIVGEARRTIQDQDFDTVASLTKYLEQVYGLSKNIYQLQGELGCIYQKNEEDVVTYANRVKLLGKQILEAHTNSGNVLPGQNIKASLERDMCKCFIRGLKPAIEQRVTRNLDVQATVADALRIERESYAR